MIQNLLIAFFTTFCMTTGIGVKIDKILMPSGDDYFYRKITTPFKTYEFCFEALPNSKPMFLGDEVLVNIINGQHFYCEYGDKGNILIHSSNKP